MWMEIYGCRAYFICIRNAVMEVSRDIYMNHYRAVRRRKYLADETDQREFLYHSLDADDMMEEEILYDDTTESVEEVVIRQLCLEQLKPAMEQLTADERNLLYDIYYEGLSERFLAGKYGVSQPAIHKRKENILKQLRKWLGVKS